MGSKIHRAWHGYLARNERRLLLVGLDNAGKTSECLWRLPKVVRWRH